MFESRPYQVRTKFSVERFTVRISPLAFFVDAPYMCGSQKMLRQDYTRCYLAFLTVVSVEVFRHQAIVGELVMDQGIECCALTSLIYLTWLVCWTSVEVAHHRAVRSPMQSLWLTCTCAHLLVWFAGVCCKVKTPSTDSARRVSVLSTHYYYYYYYY